MTGFCERGNERQGFIK